MNCGHNLNKTKDQISKLHDLLLKLNESVNCGHDLKLANTFENHGHLKLKLNKLVNHDHN